MKPRNVNPIYEGNFFTTIGQKIKGVVTKPATNAAKKQGLVNTVKNTVEKVGRNTDVLASQGVKVGNTVRQVGGQATNTLKKLGNTATEVGNTAKQARDTIQNIGTKVGTVVDSAKGLVDKGHNVVNQASDVLNAGKNTVNQIGATVDKVGSNATETLNKVNSTMDKVGRNSTVMAYGVGGGALLAGGGIAYGAATKNKNKRK